MKHLLIALCLLLVCCSTIKEKKEYNKEKEITNNINDFGFNVQGVGIIAPAPPGFHLQRDGTIVEFNTIIPRKFNGKIKNDSLKVKFNKETNEFNISYITTPDTTQSTHIKEFEKTTQTKNNND
jgi:hypothetical protein